MPFYQPFGNGKHSTNPKMVMTGVYHCFTHIIQIYTVYSNSKLAMSSVSCSASSSTPIVTSRQFFRCDRCYRYSPWQIDMKPPTRILLELTSPSEGTSPAPSSAVSMNTPYQPLSNCVFLVKISLSSDIHNPRSLYVFPFLDMFSCFFSSSRKNIYRHQLDKHIWKETHLVSSGQQQSIIPFFMISIGIVQ